MGPDQTATADDHQTGNQTENGMYRYDLKYSSRQIWANRVDPEDCS